MTLRSASMRSSRMSKVEFLSYIDYTVPPENVKPLPYVVPTYCEYWSRNQFHPITDDRASNANCRRQLGRVGKVSNQATVYSYYADEMIKRFMYKPVLDVVLFGLSILPADWRRSAIRIDDESQKLVVDSPHMYAYARAAWDSKIKLDENQ